MYNLHLFYVIIIITLVVIIKNSLNIENFDLEDVNIFNKMYIYSKSKYLNLKKFINKQLNNKESNKETEIKENNRCNDVKYDNYVINSNNVISAYYGKSYYNFNKI
jgi:predicted Holliday junction resolvase-like endonuclease